MKKRLFLALLPIVACLACCNSNQPTGKDGTILCGNIVTMDETKPTAEAVGIKDGKIVALGSKEEVSNLVKGDVITKTFSNSDYIYPGFIDTHTHYAVMSNILTGGTMIDRSKEGPDGWELGDYEAYANEMRKFVEANPNKEVYQGYGLWVTPSKKFESQTPTAEMLDKWCPTQKPIVVIGGGGHDCWLNTAAIKQYIGNFEGSEEEKKAVDTWISEVGDDCVIFQEKDNHKIPTGYFFETARFRITDHLPHSVDEIKEFILGLQEASLIKGYTTVGDCTIVESDTNKQVTAFKELNDEGKLKLKFRSYYEIREYDSKETRAAELQKAINLANETKNNDYFQVVGIKVFLDGVFEALSAYTLDKYPVSSGKRENYYGIQRWRNRGTFDLNDDLKELVYNANKVGLAMEFHAMGDAAVRQALNACQYANEKLLSEGKLALNKNAISHIGLLHKDDLDRFNSLGVTAVVAPQWAPGLKSMLPNERKCVADKIDTMYPIKSIMNTHANVAFHTDGAVLGGVPEMIYSATTRDTVSDTDRDYARGLDERIKGSDSLKCLTINAAHPLNSASTIGMIKVGAAADFSVYNKDYRNNTVATSLDEFKTSNLVALYTNGVDLIKTSN